MDRSALARKLLGSLSRLKREDALDERVRRTLVRTLYTQPSSLAIGAFNGIMSSLIVAIWSGQQLFAILAAVLSVIAIARLAAALRMSSDDSSRTTRQLELV